MPEANPARQADPTRDGEAQPCDTSVPRRAGSTLEVGACAVELLEARVRPRLGDVANRVVEALRREVDHYGAHGAAPTPVELLLTARTLTAAALGALGSGCLDPEARAGLKDLGGRRAEQGVPLHAVLRGFQVGGNTLWRVLVEELWAAPLDPEEAAATLGGLSIAYRRLSEEATRAIQDGYRRSELVRSEESTDEEGLLGDLLSGSVAPGSALLTRAERTGFRPGRRYAVVMCAFATARAPPGWGPGAGLRVLVSALRGIHGDPSRPLVGVRGRTVVGVFPLLRSQGDRRLARRARRAIEADAQCPERVAVVVGAPCQGIAEIPASYRQARVLLAALRGSDSAEEPVCYRDVVHLLPLLRDPAYLSDLYASTVSSLVRHDDGHGTALVPTLESYLDSLGVVSEAARRLGVSRNTVPKRLARIEALTHRDLRSRADLTALDLGLKAWHILANLQGTLTESSGAVLANPGDSGAGY